MENIIEVVADDVQSIVVDEELEAIAAPAIWDNHNETLIVDEDEAESILVVEELEAIVAPGAWQNHNETVMLDE